MFTLHLVEVKLAKVHLAILGIIGTHIWNHISQNLSIMYHDFIQNLNFQLNAICQILKYS